MSNSNNSSLTFSKPLVHVTSPEIFSDNDSVFRSFDQASSSIQVSEDSSKMSYISYGMLKIENVNNLTVDSGIQESESIIDEESELTKFESIERSFCDLADVMSFDFNHEENVYTLKDEKYDDAVNFFSDPLSLRMLENIGTSTVSSELMLPRNSLYRNFDPLFADASCNIKSAELQKAGENKIEPKQDKQGKTSLYGNLQNEAWSDKFPDGSKDELLLVASEDVQNNSVSQGCDETDLIFDIINKCSCNKSLRESIGNLLCFDSALTVNTISDIENSDEKIYTKKEFEEALKLRELSMLGTFLKNSKDLEESFSGKQQDLKGYFLKQQQDLETQNKQLNCLTNSLCAILKEAIEVVKILFNSEKVLEKKLEIMEQEKNELERDLNTFVEDLHNVKNKFSDFRKEYKQNETVLELSLTNDSLVQQLKNMNIQFDNKEKMYQELYLRSQALLEKTNSNLSTENEFSDSQTPK